MSRSFFFRIFVDIFSCIVLGMVLLELITLSCLLILLPLAADILEYTFPKSGIGRLAQLWVSYFMISFIVFLAMAAVYLWFTLYFPFLQMENENSMMPTIHTIFIMFLLYHGTVHYFRAIGENPGFLSRTSDGPKSVHNSVPKESNVCNICK